MTHCTEQDFDKLADYEWVSEKFGEIFSSGLDRMERAQADGLEINVLASWFIHSLFRVENVVLSEGAGIGLLFALTAAYMLGVASGDADAVERREAGGGAAEIPEAFREFLTDLFGEADDAGGD